MTTKSESSPQDLVLEMVDGVKLNVPKQHRYLTTFVLKEQGDWFEDEIKFLRILLKPGMNVVDIGANFGVYSLAIAKVIGSSGAVWAFEPASNTANHLRKSIAENGFDHITVIEKGLSDHQGEATFHLSSNSELNSLQAVTSSVDTETVQLTTLAEAAKEFEWPDIDFIKLDAEGEEGRIVEAAKGVLDEMSPLVMFELKHGKQINLPLIKKFESLGYSSYRLVPGLNMLMPFDSNQKPDSYLLNLFCCKEDRAEELEQAGFLVRKPEGVDIDVEGKARKHLTRLAYSRNGETKQRWLDADPTSFEQILNYYVASQEKSVAPSQRLACLRRAMVMSISQMPNGGDLSAVPIEQVATHARIAIEGGLRARAVHLLVGAISSNDGVAKLEPALPFLPAVARYDNVNPKGRLNEWLISSVIEQWVKSHAYSSYFTALKALPALKRLKAMGFIDKQSKKRLDLLAQVQLK